MDGQEIVGGGILNKYGIPGKNENTLVGGYMEYVHQWCKKKILVTGTDILTLCDKAYSVLTAKGLSSKI